MEVPPSPKVQDQEVGEFVDVSVNCMDCLQVWQACAKVNAATGALVPRLMITLRVVPPLPAAFVAVRLTL